MQELVAMYQIKQLGMKQKGNAAGSSGITKNPPKKAKGKDTHVLSKCIVALMLHALPACTNVTVAMHSSTFAAIARLG